MFSPLVDDSFIWPVCTILSMFLRQVLGTDDLYKYLEKYDLELDPHLEGLVGTYVYQGS